jgi:vacuolar-type H+-ATPase subunit H
MSADRHPTPGTDTLEPIKRVKATEEEAQARAAALIESVKREVDALARDAEEAVQRVRAEAEKARDLLLTRTRTEAEEEAKAILAGAQAKAAAIRGKTAAELGQAREKLLDAVLGAFRSGKNQ